MGQVVDNRRFWNRVPRTQTHHEPVVVSRPSLDTLTDAVENARNRVVHCQCELAKAENAYSEAQRAWADAIIERGVELAIPEFCQLRIAHPRRPAPDED